MQGNGVNVADITDPTPEVPGAGDTESRWNMGGCCEVAVQIAIVVGVIAALVPLAIYALSGDL